MTSQFPGTLVLGLALAWSVVPAAAQSPLPLGTLEKGQIGAEGGTQYTVAAKTAGVLTVAVQGEGDLAIEIADEDGQMVQDGRADRDLNGKAGTESISAVIPEAGNYKVRVVGGSPSPYQITASWLAFAPLASTNLDPDRRPSLAKALAVGKPMEDSLVSESGDNWDWFVLKPSQPGSLVIVTRKVGEGTPDLVLEAFLDSKFDNPAGRSDQDMQGDSANESLTVTVDKGQTVHVKVSGSGGRAAAKYRISSSLVP